MTERAAHAVRVIDTGLAAGAYNIAFDQALIDLHRAGTIPDTLRFLRFTPSALIGRHQILAHEIDIEFCRARGIAIARRITGGGALYLDGDQLGWELVCRRKRFGALSLAAVGERICTAAAVGLTTLGVPVRFRPRNDLEVDGRKIGGTGGFYDGDTLFFQGTFLLGLDSATMFEVLRVPAAKRARRPDASPAARVIGLRDLLGSATPDIAAVRSALSRGLAAELGLELVDDVVGSAESAHAAHLQASELGTWDFIDALPATRGQIHGSATRTTPGGTVHAQVRLHDRGEPCIASVTVSGDFFVTPPRLVFDLEAMLRDQRVAMIESVVAEHFARHRPELLSIDAAVLAEVVREAAVAAVESRVQSECVAAAD